jgi:hypothetical protein
MASMLAEFENFPKEKALIGEMLIAYGEIEFVITRMLAAFFKDTGSEDTAARMFFRVKGEGPRLDVADAILRPQLKKFSLSGKWGNALGAARHCKTIRNQFAHCHWFLDQENKVLSFMNLDVDAASGEGEMLVRFEPIDLPLIEAQHQYFDYAIALLYFLDQEYRRKQGMKSAHDFSEPKSIPQPPTSNLKKLLAQKQATDKSAEASPAESPKL